jgi:hypothetical protein
VGSEHFWVVCLLPKCLGKNSLRASGIFSRKVRLRNSAGNLVPGPPTAYLDFSTRSDWLFLTSTLIGLIIVPSPTQMSERFVMIIARVYGDFLDYLQDLCAFEWKYLVFYALEKYQTTMIGIL